MVLVFICSGEVGLAPSHLGDMQGLERTRGNSSIYPNNEERDKSAAPGPRTSVSLHFHARRRRAWEIQSEANINRIEL